MKNKNEIKLFPVFASTVSPINHNSLVMIRIDYQTGPKLPVTEKTQGLHYVLSPQQAYELAQQILSTISLLQTAEWQPNSGLKH